MAEVHELRCPGLDALPTLEWALPLGGRALSIHMEISKTSLPKAACLGGGVVGILPDGQPLSRRTVRDSNPRPSGP